VSVPANADDVWFLISGSQGHSTESVWTGGSGSFLGFGHWREDVGEFVGGFSNDNLVDVDNLDYQGDLPFVSDNMTASLAELRTDYFPGSNINRQFQQMPSFLDTSLDFTGRNGPEVNSAIAFESTHNPGLLVSNELPSMSVMPEIRNESPRTASLNWGLEHAVISTQIWTCDFHECGKGFDSHRELKQVFNYANTEMY
jgi:hypothetical protein